MSSGRRAGQAAAVLETTPPSWTLLPAQIMRNGQHTCALRDCLQHQRGVGCREEGQPHERHHAGVIGVQRLDSQAPCSGFHTSCRLVFRQLHDTGSSVTHALRRHRGVPERGYLSPQLLKMAAIWT